MNNTGKWLLPGNSSSSVEDSNDGTRNLSEGAVSGAALDVPVAGATASRFTVMEPRGRGPEEGDTVGSALFVRAVVCGVQISTPKFKLVCSRQARGVGSRASGSRGR